MISNLWHHIWDVSELEVEAKKKKKIPFHYQPPSLAKQTPQQFGFCDFCVFLLRVFILPFSFSILVPLLLSSVPVCPTSITSSCSVIKHNFLHIPHLPSPLSSVSLQLLISSALVGKFLSSDCFSVFQSFCTFCCHVGVLFYFFNSKEVFELLVSLCILGYNFQLIVTLNSWIYFRIFDVRIVCKSAAFV